MSTIKSNLAGIKYYSNFTVTSKLHSFIFRIFCHHYFMIYLYTYPLICLFIYLFVYLFVYSFIYLFIYLFIYHLINIITLIAFSLNFILFDSI